MTSEDENYADEVFHYSSSKVSTKERLYREYYVSINCTACSQCTLKICVLSCVSTGRLPSVRARTFGVSEEEGEEEEGYMEEIWVSCVNMRAREVLQEEVGG